MSKDGYRFAADYLRAEAKKIPLGEGNVSKGFSSTYNALVFAAKILEDAFEEAGKALPEPTDGEDKGPVDLTLKRAALVKNCACGCHQNPSLAQRCCGCA